MELELEIEKLELEDLILIARESVKDKDYNTYKLYHKEISKRTKEIDPDNKSEKLIDRLNNFIQDNLHFVPIINTENYPKNKVFNDRYNFMNKIYNEVVNTNFKEHKELTITQKLNNKNYTIKITIDCNSL